MRQKFTDCPLQPDEIMEVRADDGRIVNDAIQIIPIALVQQTHAPQFLPRVVFSIDVMFAPVCVEK